MAEWLRSGLQIRAPRFDSGRGLHTGSIHLVRSVEAAEAFGHHPETYPAAAINLPPPLSRSAMCDNVSFGSNARGHNNNIAPGIEDEGGF